MANIGKGQQIKRLDAELTRIRKRLGLKAVPDKKGGK